MLRRLLQEPPFRLLGKIACRYLPLSLASKVYWESLERAPYAFGLWHAARRAEQLQVKEITAIEFGVANGRGLLAMQRHARAIERETGIGIWVFGFDLGSGLPETNDPRDHVDMWKSGDYAMDPTRLQAQLSARTALVLGDVAKTVPTFAPRGPIGFIAFDLDLYSSTMHAFRIFEKPILPHTPVYFDDVILPFNHCFAGELLAIDDFNRRSENIKIDRWHGIKLLTAFSDSQWAEQMYTAHDLRAGKERMLRRTAIAL
jgi:hypothetical protein